MGHVEHMLPYDLLDAVSSLYQQAMPCCSKTVLEYHAAQADCGVYDLRDGSEHRLRIWIVSVMMSQAVLLPQAVPADI